jgi:hypothetical protein
MRKAFERQHRLDRPVVNQVPLNANCRDEIVPILRALQHLYSQPEARDEILRKVAADVNRHSSRKRGRRGLDYWSIVVLAAVRLGCNLDYDKLQDLAEQHRALRHVMGIGDWQQEESFDWRRIRDNLCLLRPETLEHINHAIVAEGHKLVPHAAETVRADSFVAGTNIHYPTDSSLIRADELRKRAKKRAGTAEVLALHLELEVFLERTRQVCDIARRRVLLGEEVPNRDKLFSIFEPHTQLYKRGKAAEPVQFGRQILVYEDGAGFITHIYILPRDQNDRDVVVKQTRTLQKRLGGRMRHASFDRGFHSPENQKALAEIVAHPCLPMPGTQQAARQEEEATIEFRHARQRHPGIESAINALQSGNGLERCRDRSERGFHRYIQLGALGRNLHVLGKILLAGDNAQCKAAHTRRKPLAA